MREVVLGIAEELREEMRAQGRAWLAAVRLGILRLLLAISREWQPEHKAEYRRAVRPGNLGRIMPAVRLVYSRPGRRLSLDEAAAACGLSTSQFGYIFRQTMGLSFGRFSLRARLAYVAQLLLTTELPVEAIAEAAGFSDGSHLHHSFAKAYGCTPAHYRIDGRHLPDGFKYKVVEETSPTEPTVGLWTSG
jgi:transcriptional regulator GlxA family with amidase domain